MKEKGQAFDVFKLLIAGVVAVVILAILMQIIGHCLTIVNGFCIKNQEDYAFYVNPCGANCKELNFDGGILEGCFEDYNSFSCYCINQSIIEFDKNGLVYNTITGDSNS